MLSSDANIPSLYDVATHYASLGYSVIPVYGNLVPARAKIAATDWAHFQRQRATSDDFARWFNQYYLGGVALVTGRISRLLVLDFDQPEVHHQFVAAFPHLCSTYVVTSAGRRLPHYYYRLPTGAEIASRKIAGLDLLAEGRYVVAPPTTIAGQSYTVSQDRPARDLSNDDITALMAFMEGRFVQPGYDSVSRGTLSLISGTAHTGDPSSVNAISPELAPAKLSVSSRLMSAACGALNTLRQAAQSLIGEALPPDAYGRLDEVRLGDADQAPYGHLDALRLAEADTVSRGTLSLERAVQQYQQMASQVGRNEALFRVAVRARDFGWSQQQVEDGLIVAHVVQPAISSHTPETSHQREREAQRTIASVFRRPARTAHYAEAQVGLPVSVREALLSHDQMFLLRVLDGLILKGVVAGAPLTEKMITELLEGMVGRHSVLKALKAVLPDGTAVFAPSPRTPTHTCVANEVTLFPGQKMLFVGVTESNKNRRGRPEQVYEMPSILRLCQALGVKQTASDPITASDLASTRHTRQAIHRELLRRRPGLYSCALLARRLGVSVRSVQRYHRQPCVRVRVRPAFRQQEIFWETLSVVPGKDDVPAYSTFLQDETGKRYPLDISIVRWLLKQNKRVFLMYQLPNHYSVPADTVSDETQAMTPRAQAVKRVIEVQFTPSSRPTSVAACSHTNPDKHDKTGFDIDTVSAGTLSAPAGLTTSRIYREESYVHKDSAASNAAQSVPTDPLWRSVSSVSTRLMGQAFVSPVPADALLFTPPPVRPSVYVPQDAQAYREPLKGADAEKAAQRLYDLLRRTCTEKTGYITLAKARQLLDQFGTGAVKRAVHLLEMRRNIQNPAGFLITVLRSNARLAGVLA